MESKRKVLEGLVVRLKNTSRDVFEEFAPVFGYTLDVLELSDAKFARIFGVSRPTVTRWRNGVTAPHRRMRDTVLTFLETLALVETLALLKDKALTDETLLTLRND